MDTGTVQGTNKARTGTNVDRFSDPKMGGYTGGVPPEGETQTHVHGQKMGYASSSQFVGTGDEVVEEKSQEHSRCE